MGIVKGPGYPGFYDAIRGFQPGCLHKPGEREMVNGRIICLVCEQDITDELRDQPRSDEGK